MHRPAPRIGRQRTPAIGAPDRAEGPQEDLVWSERASKNPSAGASLEFLQQLDRLPSPTDRPRRHHETRSAHGSGVRCHGLSRASVGPRPSRHPPERSPELKASGGEHRGTAPSPWACPLRGDARHPTKRSETSAVPSGPRPDRGIDMPLARPLVRLAHGAPPRPRHPPTGQRAPPCPAPRPSNCGPRAPPRWRGARARPVSAG